MLRRTEYEGNTLCDEGATELIFKFRTLLSLITLLCGDELKCRIYPFLSQILQSSPRLDIN